MTGGWPPILGTAAALSLAGVLVSGQAPPRPMASHQSSATVEQAQQLVTKTCVSCHNDRGRAGNFSLQAFNVETAGEQAELTEKMVRKLRAGQMPPPGSRRPPEAALNELADVLEARADAHAAAAPTPGTRTFQRLNRAEYAASVRDLLGLQIDGADYLPLDTKSANFDNIADVQLLSPTLMQAYLSSAAEISRLAIGDPAATAREVTYPVSRWMSQRERVDGAPHGTRGGLSVSHTFVADGEYRFRVSFYHETTGALYGNGRAALHTADAPEQVEISIDGARVALLDIDRWMSASDPDGLNLQTEPIKITAGPHRVTAAFIRRFEGPAQDLISPLEWSLASTSIADAYGFTTLPHLRDMAITGPSEITGVSPTPSRAKIFTCGLPGAKAEAPGAKVDAAKDPKSVQCAHDIIARLGGQAFRRPVNERDLNSLLSLYKQGAADGGFEAGVRMALEGILASPRFVFRFEERVADARDGQAYALADVDLASRLSYFLWATAPDQELVRAVGAGRLATPAGLEQQVRRMLADRRADVLSTRFAAQWLRLQDLDKINPDVRTYPDYDDQLKTSMQQETERFFQYIVRADRPVLDLFSADYTFLDERLARHYRIPGVLGSEFRQVKYPDATRRGLLGHGSILTLTSHADRTSPVLRGKWVMEVLLGTPPPPPPPDVPDLEATSDSADGRLRTVRERLELHRASSACQSCHRMIDPLGLSLENFDVTGAWRIKDNGEPIDATSALYDGTPLKGPDDLQRALANRSTSLVRTFTENLMTYALGRRLDEHDMPTIRRIVRDAGASEYKLSAFVLGIVKSPQFRMKSAEQTDNGGRQ